MGVSSALMAKFSALTASGFPSSTVPAIHFDHSPVTTAAGAQVVPPYAVLTHLGSDPGPDFEGNPTDLHRYRLTLYYERLTDCETAALAVKYNGSAPTSKGGFDYSASLSLTGLTYLAESLTPGQYVYSKETAFGPNATYVHRVDMDYELHTVKTS